MNGEYSVLVDGEVVFEGLLGECKLVASLYLTVGMVAEVVYLGD